MSQFCVAGLQALEAGNPSLVTIWLTERQVAELICCSLSKLRRDRFKSKGLSYSKNGRSVRYSFAEVQAYMESCKVTHLQ